MVLARVRGGSWADETLAFLGDEARNSARIWGRKLGANWIQVQAVNSNIEVF